MAESMDTSDPATEDQCRAMSNLNISQIPVDGLMKWHLYIGYSWEDREMVRELLAFMDSKGLKCQLRSSLDVKEQSQADNIKQGIIFSHKCLLYISQDYLKDPNSQLELKEAKKKLKFLGKNSVFGLVQSNVNPSEFERYKQFQLIFLKDGQTAQDCLTNYQNSDAILKDYELKMELQLGPKENIGVGVAYTYFFGFLQIIVPGFWKQYKETMVNNGITDENLLVKKMLIIIRKSVNSPPRLNEPGVEQTKYNIKQTFARAGKDKREYTLYVYKLAASDKYKNEYYFIADFPACLFALREVFDHELNTTMMRKDEILEARNEFFLTVKALLSHPQNQVKFGNQWELLLWPDDTEDHRVELSEFLHQQIGSKRLTELSHDDTPLPVNMGTFERGRGIMDYAMYAEGDHYDLKDYNRGYCVIISNYYFLDDRLDRPGGITEVDNLKMLFETLKFEVRKHCNLTTAGIQEKLADYSKMDHSKSDAFVCCLLSHGTKGRMLGTEGDSISVVELMKLFYDDKRHGLSGKPKLFFIGTCQVAGESAREDEKPNTTLQPTSVTPGVGDSSKSSDTQSDAVPEEFSPNVMRDLIPSTVDFIVSYACLPYTQALREKDKGGFYVQALCKHLIRDLEIDVALRHVNKEVRELFGKYEKDGGKGFSRPDPFHIIMPPQKFLFFNPISEKKP